MSDISTWWSDLKNVVAHPVDAFNALIGPEQLVTGNPQPLPWWLAFEGTGTPADSIASANVRAYGVDPSTAKLIAPQYEARAVAAGYDPSNPSQFVTDKENEILGFYNQQLQKNEAAANQGPSSWLLLLGFILAAYLIFKAVK